MPSNTFDLTEIQDRLITLKEALSNKLVTISRTDRNEYSKVVALIEQIDVSIINLNNLRIKQENEKLKNTKNIAITAAQQNAILKILLQQQKSAETILADVTASRTNKKRMVEINTYYNDSYRDLNSLLLYIIIIVSVLLILGILKYKKILPAPIDKFLNIPVIAIIIIGSLLIISKIYDMSIRDNINYKEYNFPWLPPEKAGESIWEYNKKHAGIDWEKNHLLDSLGVACIGQSCCDSNSGTVWKEDEKICVKKN